MQMSAHKIIVTENQNGKSDVTLRGAWSDEIVSELSSLSFEKLLLAGVTWPDFEGLAPLVSKIRNLHVVGSTIGSRGLEKLVKLRSLHLDAPLAPAPDLSKLTDLETGWIFWDKGYPQSFFSLPRLKALTLLDYDRKDCVEVGKSGSLERLDLRDGKLETLAGIEGVATLKVLHLSYLKKLKDLTAIRGLKQLEEVRIEGCSALSSLMVIGEVSSLKRVHVERVKVRWQDFEWLRFTPKLEKFLSTTEVDAVDWVPVFEHRSLKSFGTGTNEGYAISDDELHRLAAKHGKRIAQLRRLPPKKSPVFSLEMN